MYDICHLVNGDISPKNLGWTPGENGAVAVITDFDDRDAEELAALEAVR